MAAARSGGCWPPAAEPAIALGNDGQLVYLAWVQDDAVQVSYCQDGGYLRHPPFPGQFERPSPAVGDSAACAGHSGRHRALDLLNDANIMPYVAWSVSGVPQAHGRRLCSAAPRRCS
ncbi:MAG: hypothetical protein IPJ94_27740 [Chloroflexi bacterium]|nr:hypothetical protein [Chloroflexota bacterium]